MRVTPLALAAAMAISLSACASVQGTIQKPPTQSVATKLAPQAVKDCLIASSPTRFKVVEFKGGYRVWMDGGTDTSVSSMALVTPTPDGSKVDMWHSWGVFPFPANLAACTGV